MTTQKSITAAGMAGSISNWGADSVMSNLASSREFRSSQRVPNVPASIVRRLIEDRAHELYEQRSKENGHASEDWLRAESEIQSGTAPHLAEKPALTTWSRLTCYCVATVPRSSHLARENKDYQSDLAPRFTNTVTTPLLLGANVKS